MARAADVLKAIEEHVEQGYAPDWDVFLEKGKKKSADYVDLDKGAEDDDESDEGGE